MVGFALLLLTTGFIFLMTTTAIPDQANTVTLKSESENPTPLNWDWELAAQWNSESGIGMYLFFWFPNVSN